MCENPSVDKSFIVETFCGEGWGWFEMAAFVFEEDAQKFIDLASPIGPTQYRLTKKEETIGSSAG
jgi:hypothetical protein